jgi:DNA repair protein RadD
MSAAAYALDPPVVGLLRDYQQRAVDGVLDYWRRKLRNPLIEIPTGGGKSRVIGAVAAEVVRRRGRVLIATHRQELVTQDAEACRLMAPGVDVGIYSAAVGRREADRPITVASVQSIANRHHELGAVDLVIIDEAHLVSTSETTTYHRLLTALRDRRPGMQLLGLTATPFRHGQGLLTQGDDRMFDAIAYRVTVRELLDAGYLAPLTTGDASTSISVEGFAVRAGDYVAKDLELAANVDEVTKHVAADVAHALAEGRTSALLFGVSVAHAGALAVAMRSVGVDCEIVTGETPTEDRKRILADFKARRLASIASMGVLTTGFDAPCVDVLALVRPTKSASLYVQMAGRGMRTCEGKADCLVLDYGGNIARHNEVDNVRIRDHEVKGKGDAPSKTCPQCCFEQPAGVRVCIQCGEAFPEPQKKANTRASKLAILSTGARTRHTGVEMRFAVHRKRSDPDAPALLRVDYLGAAGRIASEYLGIGLPDWRGDKAAKWWSHRVGTPTPAHPASAVDHLRRFGARAVEWVETCPKGGYENVVGVELAQ